MDELKAAVGETLRDAAQRFTDGVATVEGLSDSPARSKTIRSLLVRSHRDVMQVAAGAHVALPRELDELAVAIRSLVPEGVEDALAVRQRVFVRLLRLGAVDPAWTLVEDNSTGVVRSARTGIKWAGGQDSNVALPLPTVVHGGTVHAWLPGFRDPRWDVPDSVYDITDRVRLKVVLEDIALERGVLALAGSAHFSELAANADDDVTVVLRGPQGRVHRIRATRLRTPKYVKVKGPELNRLVWAGWHAAIDLKVLRKSPGRWTVWLELARGDLCGRRRLGRSRGAYAELVRRAGPVEANRMVFRLSSSKNNELLLTVRPLGLTARLLPRPLRDALRRLRPRR